MEIDAALRHAGDLSRRDPEIMEDIALALPGYLWVVDNYIPDVQYLPEDGPTQRLIHCGRCDQWAVEERRGGRYKRDLPQSQEVECPFCRCRVEVKHVTRGIKSIFNRLNVVYYQKSAVDPDAVVAVAAHVTREYREADQFEPWTLEPSVSVRGIAVFDAKRRESARLQTKPIYEEQNGKYRLAEIWWKRVKSMAALTFGDEYMGQQADSVFLRDTLTAAIEGTPFARAWSDRFFEGGDGIWALDRIARYPCVEYMTKLHLTDFVIRAKLGALPPSLLNWNGKDMAHVLRLSPRRLGEIKGHKIGLTPNLCAVLQTVDKDKIRCGIDTAEGVATACRGLQGDLKAQLRRALELLPEGKRAKGLKYIARNRDRTLGDIADLWSMTLKAGGTLNADEDAFPRDFDAAHDRMAARAQATQNRAKDRQIAKRLPKLEKKLGFSFGGLILRPACSAAEVIREGQQLHHCVGTYVDRYAAGDTVICVLRRAVEPETPWRTVEISAKTGKVLQDRGLHNDWGSGGIPVEGNYRAALDLFWEAWRERKQRKERKNA